MPPFHGRLLFVPLLLRLISEEALLPVSRPHSTLYFSVRKSGSPPLSFHVPSERKCLQWQAEIRHVLILMKNRVPDPPGMRQAP